MDDYISREAASDLLAMALIDDWEPEYAQDRLSEIPAADVVEVRHGRWTDQRTIEHDGEWYCTACGEEVTICLCGKDKTWKYRFCPNCGANMRKEKK